jgi:hypothetical protein
MNRFTKFAAAALLSLATVPALAEGEGSFQPAQVASPAVAQPGQTYGAYRFDATPVPGSESNGPVASPARGSAQAPLAANSYNTGLNG